MSHLTLGGVSTDGRRLLLVSDQGEEFTLDITPALRAALRGTTPHSLNTRLGQLEIQMSSSLRPRDIQERIRGGESPEEVAEAAGTTVDAIMPYVGPVLAEREHIAERAQKSSIRRSSGEGGAGGQTRVLGDAVIAQLYAADGKPDQVAWDSYRRDDGRWVLTADYQVGERTGAARFVFDAPGNYVVVDNDDARWLIGELRESAAAPPAADDLQQARRRRLAAVADTDELPLDATADDALGDDALGDDALDLVSDEPSDAPAPAVDDAATPDDAPSAEPDAGAEEPAAQPAKRTPAKKRGRASVPSWDEIMFGSSD